MKRVQLLYRLLLVITALLLAGIRPVFADVDPLETLGFVANTEEQTVTIARIPRPTSKIAENVTVITSEQMHELNAHTLAEVLQTVPGIQFQKDGRTPGQAGNNFTLQGANNTHVLVMIDGVNQSTQNNNWADVGMIPVIQIERVEIIRGGASAAWGQALGGVVNIVTKSPDPDKPFTGSTFTSIGDFFTTDLKGEATGTIDRFGYYLSGGLLHSDGLLPNNAVNQNNIFGKFSYNLPTKGRLTLTLSNNNIRRGIEEVPPPDDWHDNDSTRRSYANVLFEYPLAERLNLELITHYLYMKEDTTWGSMTITDLWKHYFLKETDWGTKGKLVWGDRRFNLTTGLEYEHNQMSAHETVQVDPAEQFDKNFNRYGIYANGTLSYGALTILPGIRYDRVDDEHNELSYTLGATYRLTEKSVLRTYFAQGYSRAMAVANNTPPQKGWTVQTGIETGDIPYLWFKGTLFYNDTWNMPNLTGGIANLYNTSQIRQGVEIEVRTIPLYGFSLATGYTLTDLRDKDTRTRVEQVPGDLLKLAVTYDNPSWGLHGILNGNYVWWNSSPGYRAEDRTFLWNLHLTQKLLPSRELSPELFLTVYNLFNTAQYSDYHYTNAGRWLEGGVRFRF